MTEEDPSAWLRRYRLTATEEPTAALDEVILVAATRHAVRARAARRSMVGLAFAAVVLASLWSTHLVHAPKVQEATDYGRQEGATRYYLLNVAGVPYKGSGSEEQKQ